MQRSAPRGREIVFPHHERAIGNLGQALAAPARGKCRREGGVREINRDCVVHDAAKTGRRDPPAVSAAILIEPRVNGVEAPTEPTGGDRYSDAHWEVTFGIG